MGGKFITFEGCDGSGKTTQIALLEEQLRMKQIPCLFTREPGGTDISEEVRGIILDINHKAMVWRTEALLYAAARAQLVGELIIPAIEQGIHVICDRYVDSTLAYQGYGRGLDLEELSKINGFATGNLKPDLTILLDIGPEIATKRLSERKADRLEEEQLEFHQRVRAGYLELAKEDPVRFKIINANQTLEEVQREIIEKVLALF